MSATDIFLARQPILDRNQQIVAYELLFRSGHGGNANVTDDLSATAHVITSLFGEMGVQSVLGRQRGFINVSADLLLSDMLELLPANQIVLELLETIVVTPAVIERCQALKRKGFTLALDDVSMLDDGRRPLLPHVDVIKVDLTQLDMAGLIRTVRELGRHQVALLAEKLDAPQQFQDCLNLGFSYFQGYYFAKPVVLSAKRADPSRLALLRLLGLVLDDADTAALEAAFKQDPKLPYNLLKLVNSVAAGTGRKIDSLAQAITVIGRRQLQRWLQLLLFALHGEGGTAPNPLLQLAATRGKLMEILARMGAGQDRGLQERAFMAGLFSKLDVLLEMPMADILASLNLADDVRAALMDRTGMLGTLLRLCEALELGDFDAVSGLLAELPGLTRADLTEAQMAAIRWVNSLGEAET